jgi:exopolysaccharide biosynthesis polyprenyl glycosylphosphotransferase
MSAVAPREALPALPALPAHLTLGDSSVGSRRGRMLRRALQLADLVGLALAFLVSSALFAPVDDLVSPDLEVVFLVATLALWIVLAKIYGLYERDEERADHSTSDEIFSVVNLVTVGMWLVFVSASLTGLAEPSLGRLVSHWALAAFFVLAARTIARTICRRTAGYVQNTVIVGAGAVGQLVARKVLQHPEYRLNLVGFVDESPRRKRADLGDVRLLGGPGDLADIVECKNVDRIVVAFSQEPDARTMAVIRSLSERDVIVDVVPRLFDLVGPRASVHSIEGMPLVTLPPTRLAPSTLAVKRVLDIVGAACLLVLTAPLFAYAALRIKLDSPGPVFFRQTRLGTNMRTFTALKFRSMKVETDASAHREYVRGIMSADATLDDSGVYKLRRDDAVTPFGRWLRKTSLDELPQLINVLRGEMSLVGPRPCIPYETENFEAHHFERFLVPQGITGLWQVTARASSTFGEALEMDVAYARGWSLALDLRLLLKTPFALVRQRSATA